MTNLRLVLLATTALTAMQLHRSPSHAQTAPLVVAQAAQRRSWVRTAKPKQPPKGAPPPQPGATSRRTAPPPPRPAPPRRRSAPTPAAAPPPPAPPAPPPPPRRRHRPRRRRRILHRRRRLRRGTAAALRRRLLRHHPAPHLRLPRSRSRAPPAPPTAAGCAPHAAQPPCRRTQQAHADSAVPPPPGQAPDANASAGNAAPRRQLRPPAFTRAVGATRQVRRRRHAAAAAPAARRRTRVHRRDAAGAPPAGTPPARTPGTPPRADCRSRTERRTDRATAWRRATLAHRPPPPTVTARRFRPRRRRAQALTPIAPGAAAPGPRRMEDFRGARQESEQGGRKVFTEPGRVIVVDPSGQSFIRHNEEERFRYGARDIQTQQVGGETRTIVIRPDGSADHHRHRPRRPVAAPDQAGSSRAARSSSSTTPIAIRARSAVSMSTCRRR